MYVCMYFIYIYLHMFPAIPSDFEFFVGVCGGLHITTRSKTFSRSLYIFEHPLEFGISAGTTAVQRRGVEVPSD